MVRTLDPVVLCMSWAGSPFHFGTLFEGVSPFYGLSRSHYVLHWKRMRRPLLLSGSMSCRVGRKLRLFRGRGSYKNHSRGGRNYSCTMTQYNLIFQATRSRLLCSDPLCSTENGNWSQSPRCADDCPWMILTNWSSPSPKVLPPPRSLMNSWSDR